MKKPSNKNGIGILVSFKLRVFFVKFGQTSEMVSSTEKSIMIGVDHAQESVTSIFSQYWIKLFVKFGRWYSTGLKFLYQRTLNSWINKSFGQTSLKRPLSLWEMVSAHGDSTVLIIITLSDKEIRQVLCRKDKSKWMFDVQICTQFILRFRRMPVKEVDWVPLTWKELIIKTNRSVKKRVNSTISASRISIQSYLPCLKWTLLPFYLY